MYTTSAEFKSIIKGRTSTNRGKVDLYDVNTNTTTTIYGTDLVRFNIDLSATKNRRLLGSVSIGTLEIDFLGDITDSLDVAHQYTVKPYIGVILANSSIEYVPFQTFLVDTFEYKHDTKVTTFKGSDYTKKLLTKYVTTVDFEALPTLATVFTDVCTQCGITPNSSIFFNSTVAVDVDMPFYSENYSNFDVLQYVLEVALSFAYIGRDNKLYIKPLSAYKTLTIYEETIDKSTAFSYSTSQDYFKTMGINTLVLKLDNTIEGENVSRIDSTMVETDGSVELAIANNPFIWNADLKEAIIDTMFTEIKGYRYKSYEVVSKVAPYMDIGDVLRLQTNADNSTTYSPILAMNIQMTGALKIKTYATAESITNTQYKYTGTVADRLKRAEVMVNKVDGEISAKVSTSDLNGMLEGYAQTTWVTDQIESKVASYVGGALSDYTTTTQTAYDYTTAINTAVEGVDDDYNPTRTFVTTWFREDANGLHISKSDSPSQVSISNTQLSFENGGVIVAYINGQKMYITEVEILQALKMGVHLISKHNADITIISWVGD